MSASNTNPQQLMTASDILALLPVGERQLRNLINNNGLPCEGRGKDRVFVWANVLEWWVEYRIALALRDGSAGNDGASDDDSISESSGNGKDDSRQLMRRKLRAEAGIKELQLAEAEGKVVVIADARARLDRMFGNLRAKLLTLPPILATRLDGTRDRSGREAVIRENVETLCREISTGAILGLADQEAPEHEADATL